MELLAHLVGKAIAEFWEDVLKDEWPNELIVKVGLPLCLPSTRTIVTILNIEKTEVEGQEEAQLIRVVADGFLCYATCGKA